jgi:regulator of RNase E activity RraA
VRDTAALAKLQLGVKALAPCPLKSSKRDPGARDVLLAFARCVFRPGDWLYADGDGIVLSARKLDDSSAG